MAKKTEGTSAKSAHLSIRLPNELLAALDQIIEAQAAPSNRNAVIGVAVREWVEKNGKPKGKRGAK